MLEIRYCALDEHEKLQSFINAEWKKGHILATSKLLLDWQHRDTNKYNFVVANDTETNAFCGILGFVPVSRYDTSLEKQKDIWLAVWKVVKTKKHAGLGFRLIDFLIADFQPRSIGAIGMNDEVKNVYKFMKYTLGELAHYYFIDKTRNDYQIITLPEGRTYDEDLSMQASGVVLKAIDDLRDIETDIHHKTVPSKSLSYLINRYQLHPIYRYKFYGAFHNDILQLIIVIRKAETNGSFCLRIVDMYGDFSFRYSLTEDLALLLQEENAEYVDCLNWGLSQEFFNGLGFTMANDEVIIPNFFEPFVKAKRGVTFGVRTKETGYVIFKGDSDQDRPSII